MRYHFIPTRMARTKKSDNKRWWECGEFGALIHCWWECKMVQSLWKQSGSYSIIKYRVTIWPNNPIPRCILKGNENICPYRNLYMNVNSNIVHNSQKVRQPKYPSMGELIKKCGIYLYNGILFGHKKEWSIDTCHNMDIPWKHTKGTSLVVQW